MLGCVYICVGVSIFVWACVYVRVYVLYTYICKYVLLCNDCHVKLFNFVIAWLRMMLELHESSFVNLIQHSFVN